MGNAFITKYDPSGNVVWAKAAGGPGATGAASISKDARGYLYIAGNFDSTYSIFGADTLTNHTDDVSIFVAKYSMASGTAIWQQKAETGNVGQTESVAADAQGNVYVAGSFGSLFIAFGTDTFTQQIGDYSIFVAKLGNTDTLTSIQHTAQLPNVSIYPNPTTGMLYLSGLQGGNTIQVYNAVGEILSTGQAETDTYQINLSMQAKGIYFCKITDNKGSVLQAKFIKL